jgi:2-polyprenyl-3-methyl-5-hydroxy-6-metoxy-1,4-benzoquinol methylase
MASSPSPKPPSIDEQREFWNAWNAQARSPTGLNQWTLLRGETILRLLSSLELERPRIIDLGCGTGWLSERLAAHGQVTAIDLSSECIAEARKRAPHVTYIAGDLFQASLPEGHFDVVVSQDVLAHVIDQSAYVALAARLLKSKGYLVITTTNRFVLERMDLPAQPSAHIEQWLTMSAFRKLLRLHFAVLHTTTVMPIGSKGVLRLINSPRLESLLAPLLSGARQLSLKERLGLGYNLVAVARKRT